MIAEYIYSVLDGNNAFAFKKDGKHALWKTEREMDDVGIESKELEKYLSELSKYKKGGKNGCIVMNCNPFTKGHQYLIEYAAAKVDNLYIFVVEEDASFFPFDERLELVRRGTSHLTNVEIFPSGKFIISAYTFPGYFLKDGNNEIEVDVSMDVKIFGRHIAPALDITIRFVGEELNDFVTRKYNEEMKEVLPDYGVHLEVIERKMKE